MKKIIFFLGSALLIGSMLSCTKDYTCECTETTTVNGEVDEADNYSFQIIGASKRQAEFNCISEEEKFTLGDYKENYVRKCDLK
jgi:hypothetical protein